MTPVNSSAGTRFLLGAAGLVVLIAGLRAAAPIMVPLVLAIFLTVINYPVLQFLRRLRVPTPAAILIVVIGTFSFLGLVVLVASASLSDIRTVLPLYVERVRDLEYALMGAFETRGIPVPEGITTAMSLEPDRIIEIASGFVLRAAGFVSAAFIVLLFTIFMLSEATGFPAKLRAAAGRADADFSRFGGAVSDIQRWLAIKTLIGLVTGTLVTLWLWIIGVDFPLLWGTLAFLLNYVPNVGSLIAAIPAILFAALQLGPVGALLAAVGYLVVNIGLGNIIEPQLMGRRFGLSTLVVLISLVFWGWIWGPVGMLLSVPLTVVVKIALEHTDDFRWLAVLLGNEARPIAAPAPATATATAAASAGEPATEAAIATGTPPTA